MFLIKKFYPCLAYFCLGQYEASLKTALTVLEYEDLLEPVEIYSFLGSFFGYFIFIN